MRTYSKYEVNVSSSSKKKFYELYNSVDFSVKDSGVTSSETNLLGTSHGNLQAISTSDMSTISDSAVVVKQKLSNITLQQLKETFYIDLVGNMKDTYGRLQLTPQFAKWESVYSLQKEAII